MFDRQKCFDKINDEHDLEQLVKYFLLMCVIKENEDLLRKVQEKSENLNSKIFKTRNGRLIMQSKCPDCGFKMQRFVDKKQKGY